MSENMEEINVIMKEVDVEITEAEENCSSEQTVDKNVNSITLTSTMQEQSNSKLNEDEFEVPSFEFSKNSFEGKVNKHLNVFKSKINEIKEPEWTGIPEEERHYSITILKDGMIKDSLKLHGKSRFVFGRLPNCDLVTEHPTCSRIHAILQYCMLENDTRKKGFYLYDLGSTHGTYLNKKRVKPKVYNRVRVGYQIKFGTSSRLYVVEGPQDDQEDELDLNEIREKKRVYEQHKPEHEKQPKENKQKTETSCGVKKEDVSQHEVTWGFGEDAQHEGINLKDLFERKQQFEIKDPKKMLNGFFEVEGLDFEYEMSRKGMGENAAHTAIVRLPLVTDDGEEVVAEGVGHSKKEAVLLCATEACRLIKAYDVMRNQTREDQRIVKQRELEANDFYDSDEDSYLDRTGNIEAKRKERMRRAGKNVKEEIETYDTLKLKLTEKLNELSDKEEKLNRSRAAKADGESDSLDAYIFSMKDRLDKNEETKLRCQILQIKKELESLKNLVEMTKPALPALKLDDSKFKVPDPPPRATEKLTSSSALIDERNTTTKPMVKSIDIQSRSKRQVSDGNGQKNEKTISPVKKRRVYGAPKKPLSYESDDNFVGWTPPDDQSGDGRIHLNEKFGY